MPVEVVSPGPGLPSAPTAGFLATSLPHQPVPGQSRCRLGRHHDDATPRCTRSRHALKKGSAVPGLIHHARLHSRMVKKSCACIGFTTFAGRSSASTEVDSISATRMTVEDQSQGSGTFDMLDPSPVVRRHRERQASRSPRTTDSFPGLNSPATRTSNRVSGRSIRPSRRIAGIRPRNPARRATGATARFRGGTRPPPSPVPAFERLRSSTPRETRPPLREAGPAVLRFRQIPGTVVGLPGI